MDSDRLSGLRHAFSNYPACYRPDAPNRHRVCGRLPSQRTFPLAMTHLFGRRLSLAFAALSWLLFSKNIPSSLADGLNPRETFFEEQVRPLLIARCQECHDASIQESDLRLDSLDSILQGGLNGPAAVAGNPDESLIIHAVTGTRGLEQMPPDEELSREDIIVLRRWIKMGLPWTAQSTPAPTLGDQDAINLAAKSHWAFQRLQKTEPPKASQEPASSSSDHPIDAFIDQPLNEFGLSRSSEAPREVLVRRLYLDLIGLPPSADQVDAFVRDSRPTAQVVDQTANELLASEHHGERWARYWLDLARYADTRDWEAQAELRYPYAYTYRDYVINSLNQDKPYNEFIQEQLAADYYVKEDSAAELAALGFLTVGPQFRRNTLEQISDKIDVVSRGLMGITVTCARCHDHKYDPIPIEDYYSLYGVFASCTQPDVYPELPSETSDSALREDFQRKLAEKQQALDDYVQELRSEAITDLEQRLPLYLDGFAMMSFGKKNDIRVVINKLKVNETAMTPLNGLLADRLKSSTDSKDTVLKPWHEGLSMSEDQFTKGREKLLASWTSDTTISPHVRNRLKAQPPKSQADIIKLYAKLFDEVLKQWKTAKKTDSKLTSLPDADAEAIRQTLMGKGGWFDLDADKVLAASRLLGAGRKSLGDLQKAITEIEASHPGAPPRAMTLIDLPKPITPFVLLRGEPGRRGDRVPRQFLSLLSGDDREPFKEGSGRRELAEAITDPKNPLTTRVLVNRVWARYFGRGLVDSLDDFGLRSSPPSHPELLDYLATSFIENGWSLKWLHHTIVTSKTYQQSSMTSEAALRVDPENKLLWRQNRRRLDFEAMRDSILAVAGTLDPQVGGQSTRLSDTPYTTRRSVYAYIDRNEMDPILRTFDFASPTASAASRPETTVPQQALFGMNHPFVAEQGRQIAKRAENNPAASQTVDQIDALYRLVLTRVPTQAERDAALAFVSEVSSLKSSKSGEVWTYGYGPFDSTGQADSDFTVLAHWTGSAYQVSQEFPDPELGHVRVTTNTSHPGRSPQFGVIRRWIAQASGTLSIAGELQHARDKGDGVIGAIRHPGGRVEFSVNQSAAQTKIANVEVKAGDIIDFIVSPGENGNSDAHSWSVTLTGKSGEIKGKSWSSARDFAPPQPPKLSAMAQLAQALLLTNEFLYLD
jgi:Protein of unknown function (DUF1553)/Protein of unknown function (DUF1549)/Planctomycete cytochrome C